MAADVRSCSCNLMTWQHLTAELARIKARMSGPRAAGESEGELQQQVEAVQARLLHLMRLLESSVDTSGTDRAASLSEQSKSEPATPCESSEVLALDADVGDAAARQEQDDADEQAGGSGGKAGSAGEAPHRGDQEGPNTSAQGGEDGRGDLEGGAATRIQCAVRGFQARKHAQHLTQQHRQQPRPNSAQVLLQRLRAGQLSGAEAAHIYKRRPAAVVKKLREEREQRRIASQSSLSDDGADDD
jgi:hypothetical protein